MQGVTYTYIHIYVCMYTYLCRCSMYTYIYLSSHQSIYIHVHILCEIPTKSARTPQSRKRHAPASGRALRLWRRRCPRPRRRGRGPSRPQRRFGW